MGTAIKGTPTIISATTPTHSAYTARRHCARATSGEKTAVTGPHTGAESGTTPRDDAPCERYDGGRDDALELWGGSSTAYVVSSCFSHGYGLADVWVRNDASLSSADELPP